jgi:hypothetical protein
MFTDLATRLEQHHQDLIAYELIKQTLIQEIEGAAPLRNCDTNAKSSLTDYYRNQLGNGVGR